MGGEEEAGAGTGFTVACRCTIRFFYYNFYIEMSLRKVQLTCGLHCVPTGTPGTWILCWCYKLVAPMGQSFQKIHQRSKSFWGFAERFNFRRFLPAQE